MRQILMLSSVLLLSACLHGTHSQDWSHYPLSDKNTQKKLKTEDQGEYLSCDQAYSMPDGESYPKPTAFDTFEAGISHLNTLKNFFNQHDYADEIPILCIRYTMDDWPTTLESREKKAEKVEDQKFPTTFYVLDDNFLTNVADSLGSTKLFAPANLKKSITNQTPWLDNTSLALMPILASSHKIKQAYAYYSDEENLEVPAFNFENVTLGNELHDNPFEQAAYNLSLLWPKAFPTKFKMTMVLVDLTEVSIATEDWSRITVSIKKGKEGKEVESNQILIIAETDKDDTKFTEFKAKFTEFKARLKEIKNQDPGDSQNLKHLQNWLKEHESLFDDQNLTN